MLKINYEEISAILPIYTAEGDLTKVYFKDGQSCLLPRKTKSLLRRIAAHYACDLTYLRRQSKTRTGHGQLQPLNFSSQLLLVPVKVRHCRIAGDVTSAYINKYAVKRIENIAPEGFQTIIFLQNNCQIKSLWATKTVEQAMRQANLTTFASSEDGQIAALVQKMVELLQDFHGLTWPTPAPAKNAYDDGVPAKNESKINIVRESPDSPDQTSE